MKQYLDFLRLVRESGAVKTDRTSTGTLSHFGHQMRFNLNDGFPLVTTKRIHLPSVVHELLWFLNGDTNIRYLNDNNVNIWNEWADESGELGPVYGAQWRHWKGSDGKDIDQISEAIRLINNSPDSRRIIVSSWNVGELSNMALQPCHALFQFYVVNNRLSCQLYQRSADIFLGVPFNIASYALLLIMIAKVTKLSLGEFIHTFGDAHLYLNHLDQVDEQLKRKPYPLPQIKLQSDIDDIFKFQYEHFKLINYQSHPKISAPIAV